MKKKRCKYCSKKTPYICKECNLHLHQECFTIYHNNVYNKTNYKIDKEDLKNTYNIKNRGVDVFDQYLENSSIQRKTKKWYKKVFLFWIDATIINSKIICELKEKRTYSTV